MCFRKYKFSGVTLIELLISLTISFFILDALFSIYLTCKKNFSLQSHLSNIQENALTALQILKTDIEVAGFIGCARLGENFPLQNHTAYLFNANNRLVGTPHSMTVRHMHTRVSALAQPMQDFISLKLSGPRKYAAKQIMIISDCQSADIFSIQSARLLAKNLQLITASTPLSKSYDTNAEAAELVETTYFVNNTGRRSRDGQPIYALFMGNINAHTVEVVENINALNFDYTSQGIAIHLIAGEGALNKDWYTYVQTTA
jgi:hypothetical protein